MEKPQVDHIIKNITRLVDCTKDEDTWFNHLLQYGFISNNTWETIKKIEHSTLPRIRQMYIECMKTPNFALLIQSLKDCNNHNAAIILEEIYATASSATMGIAKENLIWFDIQQGTKYYKGREEELQQIHNYYLEASRDNSLLFVGVTGLGGIGKTELARNYAKKFYNEGQGHCIWINAETDISFLDSFCKLASQMGISLKDTFGKEKSLESLTFEVYERLSGIKYMVVFDNIENYETDFLKYFIKYASKLPLSKPKPFALMTSRNQTMDRIFGELVESVNLKVLSEKCSLSFFEDALNVSCENYEIVSDLKTLCSLLDNLPLAMQQAAAYINERKKISDAPTEIKDYLKSFKNEREKMLKYTLSKFMGHDDFSETTFFTWQITLQKLELSSGSMAKMALNVISFLNCDNISVSFLKSIMNFCNLSEVDPITNDNEVDIFKILADYSMCQRVKVDDEICVSVHRLVQMVSQIKLQDEEKWTEMLNLLLLIMDDNFENLIQLNNISHIRNLLTHTKNNTSKISNKHKYFTLLEKIHILYITKGKYREGCEFNSFAVKQLEELFGKETRETLLMMAYKGKTLHLTGEYETAQNILHNVYKNQQKIISLSNPIEKKRIEIDLLYTKTVIAEVYKDNGNYKEALKINSEVVEVRKRVVGIDHPETLKTQYNIACIYEIEGNYTKALELFLEVLEAQERVIENNHPDTLTTMSAITEIYISQGNFEKALKILLETLELQRLTIEAEHPNILATKHSIGRVYNRQCNYEKALQIWMEVLEIRQQVIGVDHPDTLKTKHNIAFVYNRQGNYDKALELYLEVLEGQQRVLGMEHPNTLNTKHNIAFVYNSQGKYEKALKIHLKVLKVQLRVIGMENPKTLATKHRIAAIYHSKGNYDKALELYLEVLEVRQRVIGMEHPDTLKTKHHIAFVYNSQGNYDKALELYLKVLELRQRVIGIEHPDTLKTKHKIAFVYNSQGKYENALEIYLELLEVRERVIGIEHSDTLNTKRNIADLYNIQGNDDNALKLYMEVLEVQNRVMGFEHPDTLQTKLEIENIHNKKCYILDAIKRFFGF